jgi:hypothetical protein
VRNNLYLAPSVIIIVAASNTLPAGKMSEDGKDHLQTIPEETNECDDGDANHSSNTG